MKERFDLYQAIRMRFKIATDIKSGKGSFLGSVGAFLTLTLIIMEGLGGLAA